MDVYVQKSNLEGKKWKAHFVGEKKKTIHFGQAGALDYTTHKKLLGPTRQHGELGQRWCNDAWVAISLAPMGEADDERGHDKGVQKRRREIP